MLWRRIIVAVAGLTLAIGVVVFAIGRVILGIAGSPSAVSSVVAEITDLPEVRTEFVDEIANQISSDPMISQYADDATVRSAVSSVLDSPEFELFGDETSAAAYSVFFEGQSNAEIDVNSLAAIMLTQLAADTSSADLQRIAEEFGLNVEQDHLDVSETLIEGSDGGVLTDGLEPIVLERTESDPDFGAIVNSVRMWSNVGLAVAVISAVAMVVLSPMTFLRRLLPLGVALILAGALLFVASRGAGLLPVDGVARADMVRAIADTLFARVATPAYFMLGSGVVLSAVGMFSGKLSRR